MSGDLEIVGFGGRVGRSDMPAFTHPEVGESVHAIREKAPAGHRVPEPRIEESRRGTGTLVPVLASVAHPILEALPAPSPGHRPRDSAPGEPFEGQDNQSIGSPSCPPSPSSGLPEVLRGVRVLVVDDEEDTVDLFAAALAACGAEVVTATSAPEALGLVTLRSPAVVVSDIAMPGSDGYWLVREIRQLTDEHLRTIPVIAVTAFGRNHVRPESLAAGFVDHLEKPVDPAALCRAVARARVR